jgi:hypothetical protein
MPVAAGGRTRDECFIDGAKLADEDAEHLGRQLADLGCRRLG